MPVLDHVSELIDLQRYDFDDLDLIADARRQFVDEGVCVLPGFIKADWIPTLVHECDRLAPLAHRSLVQGTPYLGLPEDGYPEGHPRRWLVDNSLEAVAYDLFPEDSLLRQLYEWDPLMRFIGEILAVEQLHRYADPFGALNLAVMREGDVLGWHFDMTDFVVSLAIQSSLVGGHFLNAKQIRSLLPSYHNENYDDIKAVLLHDAGSAFVRTEPMTPGTLMLFNGRTSMHKVSPVRGEVPRYVALLAYDTEPGTDSSDLLKLVRYGRLPA